MAVSIAEIIILSLLADWICRKAGIPGLIGMLAVGIALGPHALGYIAPGLLEIGTELRQVALIVILLRAGFELSRQALKRVGGKALLLAFVPATCEGLAITLLAPHLLGLSYLEAALLASVLAAVSPAVVVPLMIRFIKERKGSDKSIPSMVLAAASIDDIYVIVVHSVLLGIFTGSQLNLTWQLIGIPVSLLLGVAVGLLSGLLLYRLFERFNPRATKRVLVIIAVTILLVRLQQLAAGYVPFAALVAAMAIGFVILEKREQMAHEISAKLARVWIFAEIILFSLVGAQVNVTVAWHAGLAGAAIIALGLVARAGGVLLCLMRSNLTWGERIFVIVSYSPKATVQAAIGAAPLLAMRQMGLESTAAGETILAVAVLSIVLTAPTGAWAIAALGRRVLATADSNSPDDALRAAVESAAEQEEL